jgi:peptide/nickel transport system permease protein
MSLPGQPAPVGATEIGTTSPAAVGAHPDEARIAIKERLALLRRSKSFIAGSIIVGFWVLCAIFGELVVKDPLISDPINDLIAPSADHWFGTDKLGRDVFARVITGAREVLIVAPLATIMATVLGTALGLVTGYFRGGVDDVLSRMIEALLALPVIIMGLLIAVALGPSKTTLIITIGLLFAPIISRTVRAAVLTERELEYVAAATPSSSPPGSRSSASGSSRPRRTGACRWPSTTASSPAASGGRSCSPAWRSRRSSSAST